MIRSFEFRIAIIAVVVSLAAGCGAAAPDDAATAPAAVAAPEAAGTAVATEASVYLDVRTPEEFAAGHVEGTLHIPLNELAARWQELERYRDRDLVVYCRSGRRAASAIELLADHGFSRLTNGGGLDDMSARGLMITR